jgi:hypothetical protein
MLQYVVGSVACQSDFLEFSFGGLAIPALELSGASPLSRKLFDLNVCTIIKF